MAGSRDDVVYMYAGARAYFDAALLIHTHQESSHRDYLILPTHTLVGLSVEMLFKAVLLHLGMTIKEIRKHELGHQLEALAIAAHGKGFTPSDQRIQELIDHIGASYSNHEYRYLQPRSSLNSLNLTAALSTLDYFIDEVADFVAITRRPEISEH